MAKLKILLIDDEINFLEVMSERMKSWDCEVITASSGKEGLKAFKRKRPDVTVLDYTMPGMDGVATLAEIRKIDWNSPVIMHTAYPDQQSIKGTARLNVSAYVPKISQHQDATSTLKTVVDMIRKKLEKERSNG